MGWLRSGQRRCRWMCHHGPWLLLLWGLLSYSACSQCAAGPEPWAGCRVGRGAEPGCVTGGPGGCCLRATSVWLKLVKFYLMLCRASATGWLRSGHKSCPWAHQGLEHHGSAWRLLLLLRGSLTCCASSQCAAGTELRVGCRVGGGAVPGCCCC
jgi:hypothetical protein